MKKFFTQSVLAIIIGAILCTTSSIGAFADEMLGYEISNEQYALLANLGCNNAQIQTLTATSKVADSFIVDYIITGLQTGKTYTISVDTQFNDGALNYHGPYIGFATAQTTNTSGTGMETVSISQINFTPTSASFSLASLKYFWEDHSTSFANNLGSSTIMTFIGPYSYCYISNGIVRLGDLDGDGIVNNTDVQIIAQSLAGLYTLSVTQRRIADINLDGTISSSDLYAIAQWMNHTGTTPIWDF